MLKKKSFFKDQVFKNEEEEKVLEINE